MSRSGRRRSATNRKRYLFFLSLTYQPPIIIFSDRERGISVSLPQLGGIHAPPKMPSRGHGTTMTAIMPITNGIVTVTA
jgi:hypothetical protein